MMNKAVEILSRCLPFCFLATIKRRNQDPVTVHDWQFHSVVMFDSRPKEWQHQFGEELKISTKKKMSSCLDFLAHGELTLCQVLTTQFAFPKGYSKECRVCPNGLWCTGFKEGYNFLIDRCDNGILCLTVSEFEDTALAHGSEICICEQANWFFQQTHCGRHNNCATLCQCV